MRTQRTANFRYPVSWCSGAYVAKNNLGARILHALLSIKSFDQLTFNSKIGASWEGYAIEQISYHKSAHTQLYFYRTHTGTEIDLVLVKANTPVACIEIKYSIAPKPSKGFFIGVEDLATLENFIITPSSDSYTYSTAVVCNLQHFINKYLPQF